MSTDALADAEFAEAEEQPWLLITRRQSCACEALFHEIWMVVRRREVPR